MCLKCFYDKGPVALWLVNDLRPTVYRVGACASGLRLHSGKVFTNLPDVLCAVLLTLQQEVGLTLQHTDVPRKVLNGLKQQQHRMYSEIITLNSIKKYWLSIWIFYYFI